MMIQSSTFSTVALPFKPRIFSCCLHKSASPTPSPSSSGPAESSGFELGKAFINTGLCCCCGRRHFIESAAAASAAALCPVHSSNAASDLSSDYKAILNRVHPPRPNWYEEFYAQVMDMTMQSYEAEIAGYKSQLFDELKGEAKEVVEIGVGTGPNFRYYVGNNSVRVIGVDPNRAMEKYAQAAAEGAGLLPEKFQFLQAVGEAIPVRDASVDAVIGTLVLCSVGDVDQTLKEVKRVLKPGGLYLFVEHVAAEEGTFLRLLQNVLDPLQQAVSDGCHLTRFTGKNISHAGFSDLRLSTAFLTNAPLINSHVYGIASK
ncbi:methyltransferase-like protein 7A isoform X2 [Punica granatum]|uniref:Methyltransferase-like protein 7A isoform X2 n=1 Tax=Punica granatum TaxID=22663 RepID=A0A6P8CXW7_PUNGR|nr:methyltransferase-like protein 7A isoform X2 [Punica granatum]